MSLYGGKFNSMQWLSQVLIIGWVELFWGLMSLGIDMPLKRQKRQPIIGVFAEINAIVLVG